tara:strand:- start:264 stop:464 length:201 start_codon:yes stop_codon:yes gene_type:complete
MLTITDYPELKTVFWDWNIEQVDERTAFELIERRWSYIARENLNDKEVELLKRLTERYGQGHILVA